MTFTVASNSFKDGDYLPSDFILSSDFLIWLRRTQLSFERLFAFLVLGHGRRQLLWFEVTRHPTAAWLARQITEAFPWASAPAYLLRDNDRAYGHVFTSRLAGHPRPADLSWIAVANGCNRQAVFLAVFCYPIEARERLRGEEQGLR
jgi:hypothetical protein